MQTYLALKVVVRKNNPGVKISQTTAKLQRSLTASSIDLELHYNFQFNQKTTNRDIF